MTLTAMRLAAILLVAATAGFGQEGPAAPALRPLSVDIEDKRDIRIGPTERNADPPVLWTGEIVVPDVPYIRLFLRIEGSPFPPASRVILTNEHCINDAEVCASLVVTFGWEQDAGGRLRFGNQFRCAGFNPRLSNFELDVTAVGLKRNPGDEYGTIDLSLADGSLTGPMVIIQHSGVVPKEVSIEGCAMSAAPVDGRGPATDFTHTCDTAEGTSGAPILDVNGNFRGLHHFGFKDDDSDIWSENRGVQGALIRNWLADALVATDEAPVDANN